MDQTFLTPGETKGHWKRSCPRDCLSMSRIFFLTLALFLAVTALSLDDLTSWSFVGDFPNTNVASWGWKTGGFDDDEPSVSFCTAAQNAAQNVTTASPPLAGLEANFTTTTAWPTTDTPDENGWVELEDLCTAGLYWVGFGIATVLLTALNIAVQSCYPTKWDFLLSLVAYGCSSAAVIIYVVFALNNALDCGGVVIIADVELPNLCKAGTSIIIMAVAHIAQFVELIMSCCRCCECCRKHEPKKSSFTQGV